PSPRRWLPFVWGRATSAGVRLGDHHRANVRAGLTGIRFGGGRNADEEPSGCRAKRSSCGTSGVLLQRPYDCLDRPPEAMSFRLAISHHSESTSPRGALEAVFRNELEGRPCSRTRSARF